MRRELTCIGCPMGCALSAVVEDNVVVSVEGNTCAKGAAYAKVECIAPRRTVTSTVRIAGAPIPVISVKTREDIPKEMIGACMKALKGITVEAPVHIGDVVLENAAGTGVDVIATKNLERAV